MGLGAFAGGMAQGISQGISDVRDYRRAQHEDKQIQDEDAWKKETEDLYKRFSQAARPQQQAEQQPTGQVDQQQLAAPTSTAAQPQQDTGAQPSGQQQAQKPGPPKEFGSVADAMDFAVESSKINMKYGKASPMDLVKLKMMSDQFEREGMDTAIGLLHGGDVQGALKAYNQSGRDRVTFKGEPVQGTYEYAGQKIPTMIATVVGSDGKERQVNTAQIMTSKMGVEKQLNALMDLAKMNAAIGHQNDTLNEQRRHNIATEGISSERVKNVGAGGGKGKWVQDEDGEWRFLNTSDPHTQGMVKETVNVNDAGNVTAYDPVSGTARTIYTPEQAETIARSRAEAESQKAGKGLFSLEWNEDKIQARADEIKAQLLEQSKRQPRGGDTPSGPSGGLGQTSNNNVGNMKNPGGKTGFQQFGSPQEALSSMDKQLTIYDGRGIDTIDKIVSTYSPKEDGNDTKALIAEAVRVTGFKPGQRIDLANPAARARVLAALLKQEKPASAFLKKDGQVADSSQERNQATTQEPSQTTAKAAPVTPATAAKGGIKKGEEKPWYEKEVDIGAAVGKPMAAIGESVGKTVGGTVTALASIKNTLTEAEYQKALAYAQSENIDIGPIVQRLGADGFKAWIGQMNPAKNTDAYMARTSPKNLNQYFR